MLQHCDVYYMRAGIRKWPKEYLPSIFDEQRVDQVMEISQAEAEETMRSLARVEGEGLPLTVGVPDCCEFHLALVMSTSAGTGHHIASG
jgi:cysteine synthase